VRSWDLTGPSLRAGMTRAEWTSGDIPVTPGNKAARRTRPSESSDAGTGVDAIWLAVPLGVLALIVVVPISIGISVWLRNRRAAAEYYGSKN
jgi:hypothetical protein